jgi:hypothetical protein
LPYSQETRREAELSTPTSTARYDLFDLVRLTATIVSTDLVTLADPSSITFYARSPAGTVATYPYLAAGASVMRDGVGRYWREITVDMDGDWLYFVRATGGVQANEQWQFNVQKSIFNL